MPAVGDEQQPAQGCEVVGQPGDIADAEAFPAALAKGCRKHQRGGDPCEAGDADLGEGSGQQKTGENCREVAAAHKRAGPEGSHRAQLAGKASKRKRLEGVRNSGSSKGRLDVILMCAVFEVYKGRWRGAR